MKQAKNKLLSLLGIIAGIFAVAFVTASCETQVSIPNYTVTYSSAHGSVPEAISVKENTALSEDQLPALSDDNASFAGWYCGNSKVEAGYVVNANLALTARWEFTVTYSSQYGTAPEAINVEENSVLSAEQLPELSDNAAVFKGWYAGDTKAVPGEYQATNNVTLTARWSQLATITYHSKFGTVPESFELERNQTLTSEKVADITCSPYTFLGWFDSEDDDHNGTGEQINAGLTITNNTDLYAKWNTATVSFTTQYGTNPASIKKYTGEKISETEIPALTTDGYTFGGWFNGSTKLIADYTVADDVTFTAKWTANTYIITFKANGGTGDDYTQTVTYGSTTKLNANTFTRYGYTFTGWNKEDGGNGASYYDECDFMMADANEITLYAQWTPNEYTITYWANGGTGSTYTQKVTFGTTVKLIPNKFTKAGTLFKCWQSYFNQAYHNYFDGDDFSVSYAGNIHLDAQWMNNAELIGNQILNMTESGTIIATGEVTDTTISGIADGLKKLKAKNNTIFVDLDLSGTTGLSRLGGCVFEGCTNLKSINLPSGVEYIKARAFNCCTSLESITIPSSVRSIEEQAFYNCTSLTSINLPSKLYAIGERTFYNCTSLSSITIPSSVKYIGRGTFSGCTSLTDVNLSSELISIDKEAFYNCTSLENITIPSNVTSIGTSAFEECTSLTDIEIPSGVTSIDWRVFYNCTSLESITIPSSVTSIGKEAFCYCFSLTDIEIPSGVTLIKERAFCACGLNHTCAAVTFADTEGIWYYEDRWPNEVAIGSMSSDAAANGTLLCNTYTNYALYKK